MAFHACASTGTRMDAREVLRAAAAKRRATKTRVVSAERAADRRDGNADVDADGEEDPGSLPPIELDEDQVRAAEMICANPVTVISGKGGCGKTTVVSLVLRAALLQQEEIRKACADFERDTGGSQGQDEEAPVPPGSLSRLEGRKKEEEEQEEDLNRNEILLTAPTGSAASLLTKKTCFTAYTLHQVWVWWAF